MLSNVIYNITSSQALVKITTRNGDVDAIIDPQDVEKVQQLDRLTIYKDPKGRLMARSGKDSGQVLLHRYLFEIPKGSRLEWINGKTLDCRRENLQLVDKDNNITPLKQPEPEKKHSDVRGVYFHKASQRWHASAFWEGKRYSLGYFGFQEDAELEVKIFRQQGPNWPGLKRNQSKGDKK